MPLQGRNLGDGDAPIGIAQAPIPLRPRAAQNDGRISRRGLDLTSADSALCVTYPRTGDKGAPINTEAIRVHLSSTLISVDEECLELVGLLGVVHLYNQGSSGCAGRLRVERFLLRGSCLHAVEEAVHRAHEQLPLFVEWGMGAVLENHQL